MFCPLEEQHSIALVMLDLAAMEATFETGVCCFRWEVSSRSSCCRVSQILFPCRCSLLVKTYGKIHELQHSCSYVRGREGLGRRSSCSKRKICMSCSVVI